MKIKMKSGFGKHNTKDLYLSWIFNCGLLHLIKWKIDGYLQMYGISPKMQKWIREHKYNDNRERNIKLLNSF